jgi:hypothetical protein
LGAADDVDGSKSKFLPHFRLPDSIENGSRSGGDQTIDRRCAENERILSGSGINNHRVDLLLSHLFQQMNERGVL